MEDIANNSMQDIANTSMHDIENNSMVVDDTFSDDFDFDLENESNERAGTPFELIEAADEASEELLPTISKERYQQAYNQFQKWKELKGAKSNSERVLMSYFGKMRDKNRKEYAPLTLWACYSMLKATIKIYDNIDIGTYASLSAFFKKKSAGFRSKKSSYFHGTEHPQLS